MSSSKAGHACAVLLLFALSAGCERFSSPLQTGLPVGEREIVAEDGLEQGQWPAWRGGVAHGVSSAETLPLKWSRRENIAWQCSLEGAGNSSPVVWRETVFLTSVVGQGHRAELVLLAIDRHTGQLRWRQQLGRPVGESHAKNGHASATVATDGERVYAYFGAKGLFCFTVDGRRVWHRPFADQTHEWGFASSPLLAGPLVVQLCDSHQASFLLALDKRTGDEVWTAPRDSGGCWSTPVLFHTGGDSPQYQVVVNGTGASGGTSGYVSGYELWTGKPIWRVAGASDIVCPTAIVGNGLIVCSSGPSSPIMALEPKTGAALQPRWEVPMGGPYVPTGVIYNNRVYLVDEDGIASCLDVADGREIWRKRLMGPISASLLAGAGRIYVASETGAVHVLAAADEYQLLATNSLEEPILATPAAAHGDLFIRTQSHLFCVIDQSEAAASPSDDESTLGEATSPTILSPSDTPATVGAPRGT